MANTIKIKRSTTTATPPSLAEGELAYSENSGDFFIGTSGGNITKVGGASTVATVDSLSSSGVDAEGVQDIVGGMVTGNTESGISVTYSDNGAEDGKLNFNVAISDAVNSTSSTTSASSAAVKAAYDRTWSTAPNNAEVNRSISDSVTSTSTTTSASSKAVKEAYDVGNHGHEYLSNTHAAKDVTSAKIGNWDAAHTWFSTMTNADGDTIINTVNEIVSAFESHQEGLNLITELDAKLTASSTIDGGTF